MFKNNTEITSFDEFVHFSGIKRLTDTFQNCTSLINIALPTSITAVTGPTFSGTPNLTGVLNFCNVVNLSRIFIVYNCGAEYIYMPKVKEILGDYNNHWYLSGPFSGERNVYAHFKELYFHDVESINEGNFCYLSRCVAIIIDNVVPPVLNGINILRHNTCTPIIYVPDESVETYKTAGNWNEHTEVIKPLSEHTGVKWWKNL